MQDPTDTGPDPIDADGMTIHQRRFADAYLEMLGDPDQKHLRQTAALRAGYAESCASTKAWQNLRHPKVMAYIGRHLQQATARVGIDRAYVLFKAVIAVEKAEAKGDAALMLKALDLVGRHTDVGAFGNNLGSGSGAGDGGAFGRALENANASDLRTLADVLARMGFGNLASERAGNGEGPPTVN